MGCQELLQLRKLPEIWPCGDWETRRQEIRELLQREVYGFLPEAPEKPR